MLLESKRLLLRPIDRNDKAEIFEYRKDKETNQYQGWIPEEIKDVEVFIKKNAKEFNQPESWFQFVILEKKSQTTIGDLGVHFFGDENQQVELGCTLNKNFQNKGYATETLQTVIDYLFNHLQKHRITTSIDPQNINSIKLVERLGFRKEAHFIQSYYSKGKWVDDVVYSILASEWTKS